MPNTSSQSILLEEYRALHDEYIHQSDEGVTRMNFFITAMSVVLGSVLVLTTSTNPLMISYLRLMLLTALVIMITIGIDVFGFLTQRDIVRDHDLRGMARIRNYFVSLDPDVAKYFLNKIFDNPSRHLVANNSGMRRSTEIIVGFLVGVAVTVLSSYFNIVLGISIVVGLGATIFTALFLELNALGRLKNASRNAEKEIKFDENRDAN